MNFQKFSLREHLGGNPPDPQSQNLKNRPPPCSACISGFHGGGHPPRLHRPFAACASFLALFLHPLSSFSFFALFLAVFSRSSRTLFACGSRFVVLFRRFPELSALYPYGSSNASPSTVSFAYHPLRIVLPGAPYEKIWHPPRCTLG